MGTTLHFDGMPEADAQAALDWADDLAWWDLADRESAGQYDESGEPDDGDDADDAEAEYEARNDAWAEAHAFSRHGARR